MGKFVLYKTLQLEKYGSEWKGAYLKFKAFGVEDLQQKLLPLSNIDPEDKQKALKSYGDVVKIIEDQFVEGKAFNGTELVDVKKGELEELPAEILNEVIGFLSGAVQTNS